MSEHREQPLDLAYAPPAYPSHGYAGRGRIVRVNVGDVFVGNLTTRGDPPTEVGWDAAPPAETLAGIVAGIVDDLLTAGAAESRPLPDVVEEILATVQHDPPKDGDLSALHG